jgi:hypothetical protein
MFFLHDLNVTAARLPEIDEVDDEDVRKLMCTPVRRPKPTLDANPDSSTVVSPDFPLGTGPDWASVVEILARSPATFLRPWYFPTTISITPKAAELFIDFTTHMWLTINSRALRHEARPTPHTLEEAMQCWTLESIVDTLSDIEILGCQAGLQGAGAHPGQSFLQRRVVFFPIGEPWEPSVTSIWHDLYTDGYLRDLRLWLEAYPNSTRDIKTSLDAIFNGLHCLPMSTRPRGKAAKGAIWTTTSGQAVEFMANPAYYRMQHISHTNRQPRERKQRIQASRRDIQAQLYAQQHNMRFKTALNHIRQTRKGSRKKLKAQQLKRPRGSGISASQPVKKRLRRVSFTHSAPDSDSPSSSTLDKSDSDDSMTKEHDE